MPVQRLGWDDIWFLQETPDRPLQESSAAGARAAILECSPPSRLALFRRFVVRLGGRSGERWVRRPATRLSPTLRFAKDGAPEVWTCHLEEVGQTSRVVPAIAAGQPRKTVTKPLQRGYTKCILVVYTKE